MPDRQPHSLAAKIIVKFRTITISDLREVAMAAKGNQPHGPGRSTQRTAIGPIRDLRSLFCSPTRRRHDPGEVSSLSEEPLPRCCGRAGRPEGTDADEAAV